MDRLAPQRVRGKRQHAMRRLVGHQHSASRVRGDDGCRAALDQNLQLPLGFPACFALLLDLFEVLHRCAPIAIHLADKEARPEERRKIKHVARDSCTQIPGKIVEDFRQKRAQSSHRSNLPRPQHAAHHHHGQQIEKAERNFSNDSPVQHRDHCYQRRSPKHNRSTASPEECCVHVHPAKLLAEFSSLY